MKKKHKFVVICGLVVMFFYTAGIVRATDFSMKCDEKKCTPASISRFFDKDVLWYPSYLQVNIVTIQNTGEGTQYVGHRAFNIQNSQEGADLAKALNVTIVRKSDNKTVWSSTLREFYDTSEAVLGILGPGKTDSFEYTITMNKDAGNEYQGKTTQFDLLFGFFMPTLTPTPTSRPTPTNIPVLTNVPTSESIQISPYSQDVGSLQKESDIPKRSSLLENVQAKIFGIRETYLPQFIPHSIGSPPYIFPLTPPKDENASSVKNSTNFWKELFVLVLRFFQRL